MLQNQEKNQSVLFISSCNLTADRMYSSFDQDYAIMGSGEASGVLGYFFALSRPR